MTFNWEGQADFAALRSSAGQAKRDPGLHDLLQLDGRSVRREPLQDRRKMVFRRTAATIAARALAGVAAEALLRIGLSILVRHVPFLFFAPVVVISRNHGNVFQNTRTA